MAKLSLSKLGTMVRTKRGKAILRDAAEVIGISPATLMRVENGRVPDVVTFGKICNWLGVNPGDFLGYTPEEGGTKGDKPAVLNLSAHFKSDRTPKKTTIDALSQMLLLAIGSQELSTEEIPSDESA